MEEWLSTELWLSLGIGLLLLLRLYRPVIFDKQSTIPNELQNPFYTILQGMIVIITVSSALMSAPISTESFWAPKYLCTIAVSGWWIWSIYMFRRIPDIQKNTNTAIVITTMIAVYIISIAWGILPPPLKFVLWFQELPAPLQSLTAIITGVLAAILVHNILLPLTNRLTKTSETTIDDSLVEIIHWPISLSIGLVGIGYAINSSLLSDFWTDKLHSLSTSIFIILWTHVALKGITLFLEEMRESEHRWLLVNDRTTPIFQLLLRIAILTMSIYLLMVSWNIDVMLYITSAGVIGIAIAYASQDTLASLFAGMAILSDAPYKLHDFLILDENTKGRVTHIGFRSTRLLTTENIEIIIPNSTMANAQIINMSGGETSMARIEIAAGVAYGSDVEKVRSLLLEVAHKLDNVILDQPNLEPVAHFTSMGASSLDFTLRLWIQNPERMLIIQDQANTLIYTLFTEQGIEIPYTKQDVYLYPMGTLKS